VVACKRVEEPTPLGTSYFPIEMDKYRIYTMDSIWWDAFTEKSDTLNYFIRETVSDSFIDNVGRLAYKVKVEKRFDSTESWEFSHNVTEVLTNFEAERLEFNYRMVKLSLPVKERKTWDENAFNILDEQINKYLDTDESYEVHNTMYDSTIRVLQGDEKDPFFEFFAEEIYAKDVGLIYKRYVNTETQNNVKEGISYTKKLYDTNW
jgi:hypothetical protein